VLTLLVAYFDMILTSHESGTARYIIDLLAVLPPRGSIGFNYFFIITGEGFFIDVPLACSFRSSKQLFCFGSNPPQLFIPPRCRPW
jgi:hypothetical protein